MYVCMYIYVCVYIYMCIFVCVYVYMCMYVCVSVCMQTYTLNYTHNVYIQCDYKGLILTYHRENIPVYRVFPTEPDNTSELHRKPTTNREREVLFNDALNTFYLRLYGVRHMVKDHSDSKKGNPMPPHRLLLLINSTRTG